MVDLSAAHLSERAMRFVGTFIRFEFALKEQGYLYPNGNAKVQWGDFTKALPADFFDMIINSGRAEPLLSEPPKKQKVEDGKLGWKLQEPPTNCAQLFECVCTVRNNLAHGGKRYPGSPMDDQVRNERLIEAAQWIVERAIEASPGVREHFEGLC